MVGDRPSDMEAGWRAGCRTLVLVESGKHLDPRILSELEPLDVTPTARVAGLAEAVDVILGQRR